MATAPSRRANGRCIFPLLERDRLVGRLDIKGDGAAGALEASALRLEPRRRLTAVRNRLLEAELERTRFAGLDVVRLEDGYVKSGG